MKIVITEYYYLKIANNLKSYKRLNDVVFELDSQTENGWSVVAYVLGSGIGYNEAWGTSNFHIVDFRDILKEIQDKGGPVTSATAKDKKTGDVFELFLQQLMVNPKTAAGRSAVMYNVENFISNYEKEKDDFEKNVSQNQVTKAAGSNNSFLKKYRLPIIICGSAILLMVIIFIFTRIKKKGKK